MMQIFKLTLDDQSRMMMRTIINEMKQSFKFQFKNLKHLYIDNNVKTSIFKRRKREVFVKYDAEELSIKFTNRKYSKRRYIFHNNRALLNFLKSACKRSKAHASMTLVAIQKSRKVKFRMICICEGDNLKQTLK